MSVKPFTNGQWAIGYCDRCNAQWKLHALKTEFVRGKPVGNRVCPSCWDLDHPQNFQGLYPTSDPQALRDPRPDPSLAASRELTTPLINFDDIP
jgi:hypothetical protein